MGLHITLPGIVGWDYLRVILELIDLIIYSVHVFRDNESIGFKEALNKALVKRKYFIYRALEDSKEQSSDDKSDDTDIWKELHDEPDYGGLDIFE